MRYICDACETITTELAPCCLDCGVEGLRPLDMPDVQSIETLGAAGIEERFMQVDAPLLEIVGGKLPERGELVLVTGPPGAGKSTEVARTALTISNNVLWIDSGEMTKWELIRIFDRLGFHPDAYASIKRAETNTVSGTLDLVSDSNEAVIVLDSLHNAASSDYTRIALLKELRREAKRAHIFVIAHANKKGEIDGAERLANYPGAIIKVFHDRFTYQKCRWAPRVASIARMPLTNTLPQSLPLLTEEADQD